MDERDAEIILALADHDLNITKVARAGYMHRNTVLYHIGKIRKSTGLDPTKFYDLNKLLQMVRKRRDDK